MIRVLPGSLTARLALLFAAVAVATFAGVGVYLYRALGEQLERRDDMELIGKVALARHLLEETASLEIIERSPQRFLDALVGHHGLVLYLTRPDGRVLLTSPASPPPLPAIPLVPAGREPTTADIRHWAAGTARGPMLGAVGTVGGPSGEAVHILVARDASASASLLASYGRRLLAATLLGAALAAALGYAVARLQMRPLRTVAARANDITAHRLDARLSLADAPAELRELAGAFNAMLDRLEEGVRRLSQFSGELAHDLRTPINNLLVQSQVALAQARTAEEYKSLLASNIEEYERLARMTENALFLARAENAQLAVRREPIELAAELERIRNYFEGLAEEAGIALVCSADAGHVSADPMLFQRAVSNLVANAIRHTPSGGAIRLGAVIGKNGFDVTVENTGPGIPAEDAARIFDRYYRMHGGRESDSAGLGLAIVRAVMQLHGGNVEVRSVAEKATSFRLHFPAVAQATARTDTAAPVTSPATANRKG